MTAPSTDTVTDSNGVPRGKSVRTSAWRPAGMENGTSRVTVAPRG